MRALFLVCRQPSHCVIICSHSGVSSHKDTSPIMTAPPSWSNLILIIFQRPHLQIALHWIWGFNMWIGRTYNSVHRPKLLICVQNQINSKSILAVFQGKIFKSSNSWDSWFAHGWCRFDSPGLVQALDYSGLNSDSLAEELPEFERKLCYLPVARLQRN